MRMIAICGGLLLSALSSASTLQVTVTHPTTNTDGSSIPASGPLALTSLRVEYGSCNGSLFGTPVGAKVVPMPANRVTFPGISVALTCIRAFWSNSFGESAASVVSIVGPPPNSGSVMVVTVTAP